MSKLSLHNGSIISLKDFSFSQLIIESDELTMLSPEDKPRKGKSGLN